MEKELLITEVLATGLRRMESLCLTDSEYDIRSFELSTLIYSLSLHELEDLEKEYESLDMAESETLEEFKKPPP